MQTHLNVSWGNTKLERQAGDKNRGDGHSALDRQRALLGLLTLLRQVTLEHGESWASHVGSAHQRVCVHTHTHCPGLGRARWPIPPTWASHVGSAHQHVCAHAHTHTHTHCPGPGRARWPIPPHVFIHLTVWVFKKEFVCKKRPDARSLETTCL